MKYTLLAKTKPTKLEFTTQLILKFNFHFPRRPLFLFHLSGETCLSPDQTSLSTLVGLSSRLIYFDLSVLIDFEFYLEHLSLLSRLTSSTSSRLAQPTLSVHLLWSGFSRNIQSMFLSLKYLRNYKCFSPVSKMK